MSSSICRRHETLCYNNHRRRPNVGPHMNHLGFQDVALRVLILLAGGIAAWLLALKGEAQALPALAIGAALGGVVMTRFHTQEK